MPQRAAKIPEDASPLHHALTRIGDKWSLLLVAALLDGPRRFGDLLEAAPGIAPNILSQRLRHLEREALVVSRPYSERPPRFVYELTSAGGELAGGAPPLGGGGARPGGRGGRGGAPPAAAPPPPRRGPARGGGGGAPRRAPPGGGGARGG